MSSFFSFHPIPLLIQHRQVESRRLKCVNKETSKATTVRRSCVAMSVKHTHRRSRRRKARVSRPLSSARSPPEKMATASPSLPRGFHGHASTSRNGATGPPSIDVPVVLHLLRETASLSLMDLEEGDGSLPHSYQEQDEETLTHLSAEPLPRWHIPPASGRPDPDGYDTQMNQSITSLHSRIAAHGSPPLGTG